MHPIEPERMTEVLREARERGAPVLVVRTRRARSRLGASEFYVASAGAPGERAPDPMTESSWYWSVGDRGWMVGVGVVRQERQGSGRADLPGLSEVRRRWAEDVVYGERAHARVVGGAAFEGAPGGERWASAWRGWGSSQLWMPRFMAAGLPGGDEVEVTWSMEVDPRETPRSALRRARAHDELVDAWLERVASGSRGETRERVVGEVTEPDVARWGELVDESAARLSGGGLEKVVLARPVRYDSGQAPEAREVVARASRAYPSCAVFAARPPRSGEAPARVLVGATPEVLARLEAGTVYVDALAGTAPVDAPDEALLGSDKDQREHAHVVEFIRETLNDHVNLREPEGPRVDALSNVKHLRTPLRGELRGGGDVFSVGGLLHPTPAVCGRPREVALRHVLEVEAAIGFERGWYAGALGWATLEGDGELRVALRCALLDDEGADVFVGAGIVEGSRGDLEIEETRLKARAMLGALSGGAS